jgi:glycosyltransferase involved in cell wall biosynthesis
MKIVVVASSIIPGNSLGIEHFTYRLLNALVDHFPEDHFYVLIPTGTTDQWVQRLPPRLNLFLKTLSFSPMVFNEATSQSKGIMARLYAQLKKRFIARVAFRLIRRINLELTLQFVQPDVVYAPFQLEILGSSTWKTLITVHDLREVMTEFFDAEKASILRRNIDMACAVMIAWKHPFDQFVQMFPESRDKAHLAPFPIPISPTNLNTVIRQDREMLLFASALRPQKNHINLIRALRIIVDERQKIGKSVLLVCAGTKHLPTYERLLQEISELCLENHIEFTGFIPDDVLKELYAQAHVIVSPTLWEAASGAVFEAFAFEKPVACSHISPIVSQVEQSNGLVSYFDPNDPKDIARSILDVLENPSLFIAGAKRGAQFVRDLNWDRTARDYMRVFRQVAVSK